MGPARAAISRRRVLTGGGSLLATTLVGTTLGGCADDDGDGAAPSSPDDETEPVSEPSTRPTPDGEAPTTDADTDDDADTTDTTPSDDTYVPPMAPAVWEARDPAGLGWSTEAIDELVGYIGEHRSRTLAIASGGYLIAEAYWNGATATTTQDVASCQKSVVSTLIGLAVERGEVALDDPVTDHLGAGWTNAAPTDEARITIRHLLSMTSGLDQETLEVVDPPGTRWRYNTTAYQKLRPVLEAATGTEIDALTRTRLWDPIGVSTQTHWAPRAPTNVDATGAQLWGLDMTARDMVRFGLLVQRRGVWGDATVVDAGWFDEALVPSQDLNKTYGYLWWLAGDRPGIPSDFVAALGALDQKIFICPSLDVVLTRQGGPAGEASETESDFDQEIVTRLVAARA
jgi:CubicO group peptidase (beta-lactamase class C family)